MSIHVAANAAKESRPTLVYIVDDDECVRDAMGALVRSLGYISAIYSSAEDFLDSNRITETSCLITDLHMPGLTGIELHRRLLADGFAVPTVFYYGSSRRDDAHTSAGGRCCRIPEQTRRHKITELLPEDRVDPSNELNWMR
jgi:CheY-like chemotaxis protein